ncbi:hypothetical protein B296_00027046 [Ensete ventricosum]|uniref:Retrotransposon gag domain-containing protein n=1 Tax=Ensete ventricosum TaxID=4639 RepID=A0A426YUQ3_ENSVE|nr:hypothetical protein B296_00027046 [Ensete ventricosum]
MTSSAFTEFDRVPSGDAVRLPTSTPSASVRSLLDPDTLFELHRFLKGTVASDESEDRRSLRLSTLEAYDGGFGPMERVAVFQAQMALYGTLDAIMCRAFPTTPRGIARGWYSRLSLASIHSFDQLVREFEANFLASARPKPTTASLLRMRQKEDEPLGHYLARFTKEIRAILDAHPSLIIQALMIGIRPSRFFWSLAKRLPTTVPEMLQRANQYVASEGLMAEKREDQKRPGAESSRGPPPALSRKRTERTEQVVPRLPNTPLNSTRTEIFLQIREKGLLKAPNLMRTRGRDRGRYCHFHRDYGHDTEECYDLKNQIEDLIRRGHLDRFVRKPREPSLRSKGLVERQIDVIVGNPYSSSARKAHARAKVQKRPRARCDPEITFESESEYPNHDNALAISACIANARVKRIMIDTRSFVDILYLDTFLKLGMTNQDLTPLTSTLTGFTGNAITPGRRPGEISLRRYPQWRAVSYRQHPPTDGRYDRGDNTSHSPRLEGGNITLQEGCDPS